MFDACTMRAIKTAVEEIERAAHVLATISNTIDIDAVISSFHEERHAELDAQNQQTTAEHPRAFGMVDDINKKKMALSELEQRLRERDDHARDAVTLIRQRGIDVRETVAASLDVIAHANAMVSRDFSSVLCTRIVSEVNLIRILYG